MRGNACKNQKGNKMWGNLCQSYFLRRVQYNYYLLLMSVNDKMQAMSVQYKELKTTEIPIVKKMIIDELRKTAAEVENMMRLNEVAENSKRRRQIDDILSRCRDIEKTIIEKAKEDIGNGGRFKKMGSSSYTQAEISKIAVRSVIMKEIRSSQLRIKPEEIEEIAQKMEKNLEIMKEIEEMVVEQGNDLEKIDEYLEIAYENAEEANVQLNEAKQLQHKTRRLKFRMAISGFFGMLGYKILGLPGMVMGFLFGVKKG